VFGKRVGGEAEAYLAGHPEVFDALKRIPGAEKSVTLFPAITTSSCTGPKCARFCRQRVPGINIETDKITYERHGGRLHISHAISSRRSSPAKRIQELANPILTEYRSAAS